jgi:ABC-type glycerol-3-phosphate transport system permease component
MTAARQPATAGVSLPSGRAAVRRRPLDGRGRTAAFLAHASLALLAALSLFPVVWALLTTFKPANHIYDLAPWSAPTLANYVAGLRGYPYLRLLLNTTVIALGVTALQVGFALPTAYALVRSRFRGRGLVLALLVGSLIVPAQITLVPDYVIVARAGLLNSLPGVILPEASTIAVAVVVLRASLLDFPIELLEAAAIDGAGQLGTLFRIVVPNLRPALGAACVLVLISAWNDYFWPLLVTNQLSSTTLQLGLQLFQSELGTAWGPLLAMNTLALVPVAVLFLVAQRAITDAFVRSGIQ